MLALVVLAIPIALFLLGWIKLYLSIPLVLAIIVALYFSYRHFTACRLPVLDRTAVVKLAVFAVLVAAWIVLSGVGGMVFQNSDHHLRNSVFEALVNNPWPVVDIDTGSYLVYYLALWLPAALVGKVLGLAAGYAFQMLWVFIIICLFFLLLFSLLKKIVLWPVLVFIFFSGMDIIPYLLAAGFEGFFIGRHIEWHLMFQFSSITTQLYWVFNQAVPAWLATIFILQQKNFKSSIFLLSLLLLHSPFPSVGILPFMAYKLFWEMHPHRLDGKRFRIFSYLKSLLFDILSPENIIAFVIAGASALYILGNTAAGSRGFVDFSVLDKQGVIITISTVLCEFLLLCILIAISRVDTPLLVVTGGTLLVCMLIKIGYANDFVMRASIPALVVLYVLTCKLLDSCWQSKKWPLFICTVALLLVGSITPISEMARAVNNTEQITLPGGPNRRETVNFFEEEGARRDNFTGALQETFFSKYIMKAPRE